MDLSKSFMHTLPSAMMPPRDKIVVQIRAIQIEDNSYALLGGGLFGRLLLGF